MVTFLKTTFIFIYSLLLPASTFALANSQDPATVEDVNRFATFILRAVLGLVAIASLIMLVMGGFTYLTASDDKAKTQSAQKTITYSLGGLIMSLSAWVVLQLAGTFLGIDLSVFDICLPPGCP